ncbi:hypothetical protein LENED_006454 [Lentinula edodes]|uniref:Uncharacterized protein n=1 Tax=Lentinula edodes TaxID=5353 RepID=A0A1Q3EBY8_LENED|nr:hypothetical protein LENED_006454 [Lentinula edodes]
MYELLANVQRPFILTPQDMAADRYVLIIGSQKGTLSTLNWDNETKFTFTSLHSSLLDAKTGNVKSTHKYGPDPMGTVCLDDSSKFFVACTGKDFEMFRLENIEHVQTFSGELPIVLFPKVATYEEDGSVLVVGTTFLIPLLVLFNPLLQLPQGMKSHASLDKPENTATNLPSPGRSIRYYLFMAVGLYLLFHGLLSTVLVCTTWVYSMAMDRQIPEVIGHAVGSIPEQIFEAVALNLIDKEEYGGNTEKSCGILITHTVASTRCWLGSLFYIAPRAVRFADPSTQNGTSVLQGNGNRLDPTDNQISKPPGVMGKPGQGGYSLRMELDWTNDQFESVEKYIGETVEGVLDVTQSFDEQSLMNIKQIQQMAVHKYPFLNFAPANNTETESPTSAVSTEVPPIVKPLVGEKTKSEEAIECEFEGLWKEYENIHQELFHTKETLNRTLEENTSLALQKDSRERINVKLAEDAIDLDEENRDLHLNRVKASKTEKSLIGTISCLNAHINAEICQKKNRVWEQSAKKDGDTKKELETALRILDLEKCELEKALKVKEATAKSQKLKMDSYHAKQKWEMEELKEVRLRNTQLESSVTSFKARLTEAENLQCALKENLKIIQHENEELRTSLADTLHADEFDRLRKVERVRNLSEPS